jgi:Holliday junction resolvasome RuvABC endonuclease subunit
MQVMDSGCVKTEPSDKKMRIRKSDDRMRRISEINQKLKQVIETHGVSYIVSELPHGSQNAQAAMALGMVSGVVQTIADFTDMGIEWFSEGDSKKATLFKISSTKQDMIDAIDKIFDVRWSGKKYIDEAVADSLSVYNCAMKTSPFIKTLNR